MDTKMSALESAKKREEELIKLAEELLDKESTKEVNDLEEEDEFLDDEEVSFHTRGKKVKKFRQNSDKY